MQAAAHRHRTTPKPHATHGNPLRRRPDGRRRPAASTASDNYLKLRSDVCLDSGEGAAAARPFNLPHARTGGHTQLRNVV